jgi:predicted metalloendopeptidase
MRFLSALLAAGLLLLQSFPALRAQTTAPARSIHGIDLSGIDRTVKPGDDFFRYANGAWDQRTTIPADHSTWGLGAELDDETTRNTGALLEQAATDRGSLTADERKAGNYYRAYMDEAAIERRGLSPLASALDRVTRIADRGALAQELGSMLRADVDPLNATNFHTDRLFGLWVAQDFNGPSRYAAYLLQGGLAMPDREFYLADTPQMRETRAKYLGHVGAVLRLAGIGNPDSEAQQIVALETKIARVHATREESADVHKANNQWRQTDFATRAPGLDWTAFFKSAGVEAQPAFIVWQPAAITGESALVASEPLDVWKAYLRYMIVDHWSGFLPDAFVNEHFDFYGKVLSGTPQLRDRWKRAVASTSDAIGDAVGQMYVKRYFPPESKTRAQAMVSDLKTAFAKRIDRLDWMSPQTKAKAKEKLRTLIVGVGYPDKWRDYSGLTLSPDDALGNAIRAEEFEYRYRLAELGRAVDRDEWWMTPQTVNALNLPIQNALNFPAAILQPPFFDAAASTADNYGAIGAVIGHEISHSFDDQGSQFDAEGRLANWWTPDDFAHFNASSDRLVAEYNAYRPLPDVPVNGRQTLSENIADLAGLAAAYDAYRLAGTENGGRAIEPRSAITPDQEFFLSFAQSWRSKFREPVLRVILLTDGHAPPEYRADTVRNLDPWYAAFSVKPGEKLYLAPEDRVRIW